jgi:hypothetical protein
MLNHRHNDTSQYMGFSDPAVPSHLAKYQKPPNWYLNLFNCTVSLGMVQY